MSTSKEDLEEQFNRLRMAVDERAGAKPTGPGEEPTDDKEKKEEEEVDEKLDDTISAEEAQKEKEAGNASYKSRDYETAIKHYTRAALSANTEPGDRAIYLANRAAANLALKNYQDVVKDTTQALRLKPGYTKAHARRKEAREHLEEWSGALEDAQALKMGAPELKRLASNAQAKTAKDREEAMASIKGLGNSLLSNFGMSLEDFKFEKDPKTGSYNINLKG